MFLLILDDAVIFMLPCKAKQRGKIKGTFLGKQR